jgi:hypothetical protein
MMILYPLIVLLLLSMPAWAATRLASVGGTTSGNCTSTPCELQYAINQTGNGDTLTLASGTYSAVGQTSNNMYFVPSSVSGTSGNRTQIRVVSGANVLIKRGIDFHANWVRIYGGDGTLIIHGENELAPNNTVSGSTCNVNFNGAPFDSPGATGLILESMELRHGACDIIAGAYFDTQFINLIVHHAAIRPDGSVVDPIETSGYYHGIYASGVNVDINGGYWHDNDGYAVHRSLDGQTNWTVRNVRITDNRNGGIIINGPNALIYNNVIVNNFGKGVQYDAPGQVYNNTFVGNGTGIRYGGSLEIRNNLFVDNDLNIDAVGSTVNVSHSFCQSSGDCPGSNNVIASNPGFINAAGGNYRISAAGSPPVNAGMNLSSVFTNDADNLTRPAPGNNWTIGAYEFNGGGPVGPLGLVQHLKCDGNTLDSSPNGFNGTPSGGVLTNGAPIVIDGAPDNSCVFDGINDSITSPNNLAFRPPEFGMSVWVNTTTLPPSGLCRMMSIGTTAVLGWNDLGLPFCYINNGPTITGTSSILTGLNEALGCSYDGTNLRLWRGASGSSAPLNVGQALSYGGSEVLAVGGVAPDKYCAVRADNVRFFDQPFDTASWQNIVNEVVPSGDVYTSHMRYYADAAEGSPLAAVDTNLTVLPGVIVGMRFAIHNTAAGITEYFPLWCSRNASAFVNVTNSFGSLGLRIANSAFVNMGQATSVLLPLDTFTGIPGRFVADTINTSLQTTIAPSQHSEWEYRIETGFPATGGDFFVCVPRRESDAVFNAYTNLMTLTLQSIAAPTGVRTGGVMSGGVGN